MNITLEKNKLKEKKEIISIPYSMLDSEIKEKMKLISERTGKKIYKHYQEALIDYISKVEQNV